MKSAKIHILDELEEIRFDCQRQPSQFAIHATDLDILALKSKNTSKQSPPPKINTKQSYHNERETPRRMKSYESFEEVESSSKPFSLKEYCQSYISSIIHEERLKQVVCKILGISYHHLLIQNIATILRDQNCSSSLISDTFDPNHIKLSNPAKLYSSLESHFGPTKSTNLSLNKIRSRVLSLTKLKTADKRSIPPGIVILLHPATTTLQVKYKLILRYRSSITKQQCIASVVFWGNGNLYSNHMTTVHNLPSGYITEADSETDPNGNNRRLAMIPIGGDLQEHLKNSLPGYNGRIPIWLPCHEVEISLEEYITEDGAPETEDGDDWNVADQFFSNTPIKKTERELNQVLFPSDSFEYTPEKSRGRDKNILRLYSSQSFSSLYDDHPTPHKYQKKYSNSTTHSYLEHSNSSPLFSTPYINPASPSHSSRQAPSPPPSPYRPFEHTLVHSTTSQECVIHFKYFACSSLETTLRHLALITYRCQQQAIASLTLPGSVPALNTACMYGNVPAVKKFLEYGADPNRICGSTYSTPLHDAVLGGHGEIIKLLLSKGSLQILVDENRWTPLHLACWKNDVQSIRSLLMDRKHACEAVRMKDRHGQTPNHLCKRRLVRDIVEKFMTDHNIPIKKATWWNTLSNSFRVRVDGKERDHRDAIKQYVIKARMKGQAPKDSDYY